MFIRVVIILLIVLATLLVIVISSEQLPEWQVPTGEKILSAATGDDGVIYLLTGDPATANPHMLFSVTRDGRERWYVTIPDLLDSAGKTGTVSGQIVSVGSNAVYLYLHNEWTINKSPTYAGTIYAISPTGSILWSIENPSPTYTPEVSACESNGQVYLYFGPNRYSSDRVFSSERVDISIVGSLIVTDLRGNVLWTIANSATRPALSPDSYIYAVTDNSTNGQNFSSINAFFPNGTLYWSKSFNGSVIYHSFFTYSFDYFLFSGGTDWLGNSGIVQTTPVYHNGTIYLVYPGEVVTFDRAGTILWNLPLENSENAANVNADRYVPYWPALFDPAGDFYVVRITNGSEDLLALSPDGNVSSIQHYGYTKDYRATNGNLIYYIRDSPEQYRPDELTGSYDDLNHYFYLQYPVIRSSSPLVRPDRLDNLSTATIAWDDVRTWQTVANVTLLITDVRCATVTADNVDRFFQPYEVSKILTVNNYNDRPGDVLYRTLNTTTPVNFGHVYLDILPSGNITYVSLYAYNSQDPVTLGSTKIYYYSAIYAIDHTGSILWTKPTDFGADLIDADNTTVYYSTNDGRISSAGMYVAGGITLAGILYVAIKFFSAGLVTRARKRLDKNENRNAVMQFVVDYPGSTLREISRGTGVNLGTIRYHMFILGINHKTVTFQSDGKHVRYFQNSNTYSKEEQLVLSLSKRDKIRYLLKMIVEQPGISNQELARALGLKESAVSRYMKELSGAGIVEKAAKSAGCSAYSIKSDYVRYVESTVSGIGG